MQIYAGIGSRATPENILTTMTSTAIGLGHDGWLLRSGGADGADAAFERGCDIANGAKEIWLPWRGFNGSTSIFVLPQSGPTMMRAWAIAESMHPAWHACSPPARRLHARNVLQILGGDMETPVQRVICWTPDARIVGGTATAIRLAMQYDIEVINLANGAA